MARRRKQSYRTEVKRSASPKDKPRPRAIAVLDKTWFAWFALALVTALAYVNAWPDVLVFDDKEFLQGGRFSGLSPSDFASFFSQTLWEASGNTGNLYRPMMLVMLGLEASVFGQWWAGFHLVNVLLHVAATLLVFGLVREMLRASGTEPDKAHWSSMASAMIFGVHPVLTDAVNSVFNGSEIYVTILTVGALWYLLLNHRERPFRAWVVVGLLYLVGLLFRENAVALPVLAVFLLWMAGAGGFSARTRRCLPVFLLLIPLAIYAGLRANALESSDEPAPIAKPPPVEQLSEAAWPDQSAAPPMARQEKPGKPPPVAGRKGFLEKHGLLFEPSRTRQVIIVWFDGLKLMVWPHPLVILRAYSETSFWLALAAQSILMVIALWLLFLGRPLFFTGLVFFYLAILPSSRIISEGALPPFLLERMMYLPSVGLALVLAGAFIQLARRFSPRVSFSVAALAIVLLVPVTWARNHAWSDELRLLEGDFANQPGSPRLLISLVRANAKAGNTGRSIELCNRSSESVGLSGELARECGTVFVDTGNYSRAEQIFVHSLGDGRGHAWTHFQLARLYVRMDRRDDAERQFNLAIDREKEAFLREFMTAVMLVDLHPGDRSRLLQAKIHLETALELQPRALFAREFLEQLERKL